jgi:hypothetical protein
MQIQKSIRGNRAKAEHITKEPQRKYSKEQADEEGGKGKGQARNVYFRKEIPGKTKELTDSRQKFHNDLLQERNHIFNQRDNANRTDKGEDSHHTSTEKFQRERHPAEESRYITHVVTPLQLERDQEEETYQTRP